ncbi:hypothetical protein J4N45_10135 [Vibrio sp. SCSIO 43140]|uniref:hypothetical protein n=1 Tax=Vibrio sp. SCSIO 43140 TaxID=2819100 RepID=UPI002074FCF9|nr:hypothetical protein [Vibrio sp. SCSIO 43140]USD58888.1 hypothetical protein J4N45_10135 [Vibrio sp. SCSIO 43140]
MPVDPNKKQVFEKVVEHDMLPLFAGLADQFGKLSGARIEVYEQDSIRTVTYEYGRIADGSTSVKPATGY